MKTHPLTVSTTQDFAHKSTADIIRARALSEAEATQLANEHAELASRLASVKVRRIETAAVLSGLAIVVAKR